MYSVPMALVDFIPVFFFLAAAVLLQRGLYNKMSKGAFALFAAGTIDIFMAGFLKALYKLLYAANVCDFERLSAIFFPLQSIGFMLTGIGLLAMLCAPQGKGKIYCVAPFLSLVLLAEETDGDGLLIATLDGAAPAVYEGTLIFILLMVIGLIMMCTVLAIVAFKMKKVMAGICFIVSCIFSMMMGYLATKTFDNAILNWMAEIVNVFGQGLMFLGAFLLTKAGLKDFELK